MLIEHRAGTREVHNKLEKNRRAHLRECFEFLRKQLPAIDDKKLSNLGILKSALRHIQVKMRAFISTQLLTSMFNVTLLTRRCLFACLGEWSCRRCDEQNELRCPFFFFCFKGTLWAKHAQTECAHYQGLWSQVRQGLQGLRYQVIYRASDRKRACMGFPPLRWRKIFRCRSMF